MSEIEKYYNGEIHVDFDDEIEELKADIEEYRDSTTWWSNRFNAVERDNRELRKEINKLKSIIKEVRELVENGVDFKSIYFKKVDEDTWKLILASHIKEDFLEILDKGE